jgi:hypothetical protein
LEQAHFGDGCRQLVERILIEGGTGLPLVRRYGRDRDFLEVRSGDLA